VPGGGGVTLVDGGSRVLSVTVPSVGGYAVDPATGEITFSPVYGYAGTPAGVAYEVTDAFGQTGSSRYVPQVTAPAPPAPADAASAGVGTLTTRVTLQIPPSGSITLLDGHGDPVAGLAVDGVGTYALDPSTGVLSFTAVPGYTGSPPAVRYRVTDAYGQRATAGYTPTITAPEGPAAGDVLTSGAHAAAQHRTVPVPQGGTVLLLAGGVPAATLTVPGEGVYTASPLTGELTFAPEPGFHGAAAGVGYIVTDAYGQTATARFIPTVAAPPAKDGADPSPGPIAEPVPAPPAPGPALRVAPLLRPSADGTVVPVTCTLPGGRLDGCRVTLTGRIGHRTVVVGRAGVSLPEGRTADRVTVWVPLTPDGRSRARRGGGLRITARAVVRSGPVVLATAPRRARIAAEVPRIGVRPVLFSTDSAAIGPADAAYLRRLHRRLRDAGVRGVVCQGRADARSGPAHNRALGQARARAVCARLVRRTHLWSTTVVSLGEGRPVATNATASGMRLNRRTDIRLIW
jgi:CshA-type fibril repeat protein